MVCAELAAALAARFVAEFEAAAAARTRDFLSGLDSEFCLRNDNDVAADSALFVILLLAIALVFLC